jgi:hypothetical protein
MHRAIPQHVALQGKNAGFCRQEVRRDVASEPQSPELSARHCFAMIGRGSSNRLHSLPSKEFGYAISESYYHTGVRRGVGLLGIRCELGRVGAPGLLRRNIVMTVYWCHLSAVTSLVSSHPIGRI